MGPYNRTMGLGYGFGGGHLFMMLLIVIILIFIAVLLYKQLYKNKNKVYFEDTSLKAIELLNQRLASGEINEEEYLSKKKLILDKK